MSPTKFGILLTPDGDVPDLPELAADRRYVAQACAVAIRTHRGAWFLDTRIGLPFVAWIQAKPSPLRAIEATVRRTLEGVDGVDRVQSVDVVFRDTDGAIVVSAVVVVDSEAVRVGAALSPTIGGNAGTGSSPGPGFA